MSTSRQAVVMGLAAVAVAAGVYVFFRAEYAHNKRLRVVVPGRFYRSGQLTEAGFAEAIDRLGLRTIVNVQDDVPDPDLPRSYWDPSTRKESVVCAERGVRYVWLSPDLLPHGAAGNPRVIAQFLAVMDDEANYPVLLHCKAGLHRTGLLAAVYRMQYQGWSKGAAYRELKAHGFGAWACTSANDYVAQYVLHYTPRPQGRPGLTGALGKR
jgi:protein tyrosine/serine phosphatase